MPRINLPKIIAPECEAYFPFLTKTYPKFENKGAEYKITLLLDPNIPEHKAFLSQLKALWEECGRRFNITPRHKPFRQHFEREEKSPTNLWETTWRSNFRPSLFDAFGNNIRGDLLVGNGSLVKASGEYKFYGAAQEGGGVKIYLRAVQILELVEWHDGDLTDYGFTCMQNGYNVEATFQNDFQQVRTDQQPGDDIPNPDNDIPNPDNDIPNTADDEMPF